MAHNRLDAGGWAREVTVRELPIATTLAGVNMRLKPGGVRELHWHKQAEWAYMLDGRARLTAIDQDGRNFIDDELFKRLESLKVPPSPPASDAAFLRRVSLDLTGEQPTPDRVREFLKDTGRLEPDGAEEMEASVLRKPYDGG